ncbi:Calx-beta domain-containing protein [Aphanizomenon sp. PH219]|nr:Calx-beta domain-containing protein [Aphanizomenon sp. 202]MDK2461687.1 Calx-beta domain-containing protein [Aphanizomenon sp. PH219]
MTNHSWQSILKTALAKLRRFAGRTDFDISLQKIFGVELEDTALLKQAWLTGNFGTLPNLQIIASSQINNARGAFAAATNTLYLSEELIKTADLNAITAVFLEEYGHYLDSILNYQDTAGDEGEYFAAVVTGKILSLSDIIRLQTENDQAVVTLAGRAVVIEQNLPVISVGITPINANENNTPGSFTLGRSGDTSSSLSVNYTIGGTATNGTDYSSLSGTVTFAAGSATATVVVNPINDNLYETQETVILTLTTATTYTIGNGIAALTIIDDDIVVTQLTNNSSWEFFPKISGNNIVWYSESGLYGAYKDIFFYNGTSTTQLTNSYWLNDNDPQISGNNIVWYSQSGLDNEIFFYNGTSTIQLTNNENISDISPQISGNNVVWQGYDGINYQNQIYFYNGTSTIQLTNNGSDDSSPAISGNNVVWRGYDGINYQIYFYNGISTIQLTSSSRGDFFPAISSNNVVWRGYDGNDYEIYLYNGTSTIQLSNNSHDDLDAKISGNNVVWSGNGSIFFYNGTNTIQLSSGNVPQISGNNVVWQGWDGRDYEIFFYNGTSTIQLTNNGSDDIYPAISGNNVVWQGWDGTDYEIYQTNLDPKILPTITLAVSPSSVTEDGTANLIYTFTRTGVTTSALTVYHGIAGTANGSDYTGATPGTGIITFAAGASTATLTIDPTADTTVEIDKTVAVTLTTGTGYTVGTTTAVTGTITNDDVVASPTITLAVSPSSVTEDGTANFIYTFTRTGLTTGALTVNYGITGTADSSDYTGATPGTGKTITFAAGASTATLTIDPTVDTTVEIDKTVAVTLATGAGYTVGTTTAVTGTITNDDGNFQQITSLANLKVAPGKSLSVPLFYNTSTNDNTLGGIGLRLHYDSSDIVFKDTTNLLSTNLFGNVTDNSDTENFDADTNTNRYIQFQ